MELADEGANERLLLACERGDLNAVKQLLSIPGINVNFRDKCFLTPLLLAIINNHIEIAVLLLERDDVNVDATDIHGRSGISWAVCLDRELVVEQMLPKISVSSAENALHEAIIEGNGKIVALLLGKEGIDVNQPMCFCLRSLRAGRLPIFLFAMTHPNGSQALKEILACDKIDIGMHSYSGGALFNRKSTYASIKLLAASSRVNDTYLQNAARHHKKSGNIGNGLILEAYIDYRKTMRKSRMITSITEVRGGGNSHGNVSLPDDIIKLLVEFAVDDDGGYKGKFIECLYKELNELPYNLVLSWRYPTCIRMAAKDDGRGIMQYAFNSEYSDQVINALVKAGVLHEYNGAISLSRSIIEAAGSSVGNIEAKAIKYAFDEALRNNNYAIPRIS